MLGRREHVRDAARARDLLRCSRAALQRSRCDAAHRKRDAGSFFSVSERAVGQIIDRHFVRSLRAAVEPFRLKHEIHLGRVRNGAALRLRPFLGERFRVRAAAFEAGTVTGRERRHLVEEEQRGVAVAPDRGDGGS